MSNGSSDQDKGGVRLSTPRLELEPLSLADVPYLHALWTDPSVRRYLWDDRVIDHDEVTAVVRSSLDSFDRNGFGIWLLRLKPGLAEVGFCGLRHFGDPPADVEVLYSLSPSHWHCGLATEAATAVIQFAFTRGVPQVFAVSDPPNFASQRVIQRLGMAHHGTRMLNGLEAVYFSIDPHSFAASGA